MKRPSPPTALPEPVRLIHEASPVAELLRRERNRPLSPPMPFGQMMARARPRRARGALLWAAAFAVPLGAWIALRMPDDGALIAAEVPTGGSSVVVSDPSPTRRNVQGVPSTPGAGSAGRGGPRTTGAPEPGEEDRAGGERKVDNAVSSGSPRREVASRLAWVPTRPKSTALSDSPSAAGGRATGALPSSPGSPEPAAAVLGAGSGSHGEDCSALSRRGAFDEAVACFDQKGKGQGVGAELALLEGARIAWKALHSFEMALERLGQYEARFERGALLREAILLKVEVLQSAGRLAAARELIEKAIVLVPERGGELRKQAFDLAVRQGRCDLARRDAEALVVAHVRETLVASALADCERRAGDPSANVAGARTVR